MRQYKNLRTQSLHSNKSQNSQDQQKRKRQLEKQQQQAKTSSNQLKALLYKNFIIQKRQPCTPICSIVTPIICIFFTILIRNAVFGVIPDPQDNLLVKQPMFPFFVNNHDYDFIANAYIIINPPQWFQYDFQNRTDIQTVKYVGTCDGSGKNTGMLDNIPGKINYKSDFNSSLKPPHQIQKVYSPVFRSVQQMSSQYLQLNQQLQSSQQLNFDIFTRNKYLNNISARQLKNTTVRDVLPDGAVIFKTASNETFKALIQINDIRAFQYYRMSGVTLIGTRVNSTAHISPNFITTQGIITLMDMLDVAYIKTVTGKKISTGYAYMPVHPQITTFIDMLINSIAMILFPLSLSLLLPVFLYTVVLQKQQKLIQMMRMNGMGMASYWFNYFLFNFILSVFTNSVFFAIGYIFLDDAFFKGTGIVVLVVVLLGWALSQIGMSVFFQVFLTSSMAANIVGYLISIWTNLVGATLSVAIYQFPQKMTQFLYYYPTFSFNRIFYLLFTSCSSDHCVKNLSDMSSQLIKCTIILYASFPVFFLIGIYLHQIVPQQYGVRQSILYPFKNIQQIFQKKKNKNNLIKQFQKELLSLQQNKKQQKYKNQHAQIDQQSMQQQKRIRKIQDPSGYALICSKLQKVYDNNKKAVSQLDLVIQDNQIFGLLGPNGAGKTTLISMITGVFSPTQGTAYIGGYSIITDIRKVHLAMGVCPQFDILWPQLTVQQHLYFYARLKGVKGKKQSQMVNKTLKQVNLEQFKAFQSRKLSGGMKRRLSVGISLVGSPRIVFLDQPTTGLDPQNRRQLWQVLSKLKRKRSLFLTTHSMQQADTLCNRIGIITNGHLRTVGPQLMLKRKYGKGYFLTINLQNQNQNSLVNNNSYQPLKSNQFRYQDSSNVYNESVAQHNFGLNGQEEQKNNRVSIMSDPQIQEQNMAQMSKMQREKFLKNSFRIKIKIKRLQKVAKVKELVSQIFPKSTLDKQISGFLRFNLGNQIKVSQILSKISECQHLYKSNPNSGQFQKYKYISQGWAISNSTLQDVFFNVVQKYQKQINDNQKDQRLENKNLNNIGSLLTQQQHYQVKAMKRQDSNNQSVQQDQQQQQQQQQQQEGQFRSL